MLVAGGATTLTVADIRWARCDVKSTSLLANVLAQQQAKEAGAHEAVFVRDGIALEGSHSNLFAVRDGEVWTYPACNYILDGITRVAVLALAAAMGIPVRLGAMPLAELYAADEVFLTGTTTEVLPVVAVDGRRIGDGAARADHRQAARGLPAAGGGARAQLKRLAHCVGALCWRTVLAHCVGAR